MTFDAGTRLPTRSSATRAASCYDGEVKLVVATAVLLCLGRSVARADCESLHSLFSDLHASFQAKNTFSPHKQAAAAWPLVPAACQTGQWYLAAAILFELGDKDLTAGDIKIASEESALTLALQQPDDLDVLARVALVSALGRKPALPDDACTRAKAIASDQRAAYVCARAAIAAGDGVTAKTELAAITAQWGFPDADLARAQAAKLRGDVKTRKAKAKLAMKLDYQHAQFGMLGERDRKTIIQLAKQLSR